MVRLTDYLDAGDIVLDVEAATPEMALARLCESFPAGKGLSCPGEEILRVLLDREGEGSTGIGDGVAIPHGRVPGLEKPLLIIGRSPGGIAFRAVDNEPVHLFFLLLVPEKSTGIHLQILARLSRILQDRLFREKLMAAGDAPEVYALIAAKDEIS